MKRRVVPRMWQVLPCVSRRTTKIELQKDIEVILKMKLGTIQEELEFLEEPGFLPPRCKHAVRKGMRKLYARTLVKTGQGFVS